MCKGSGRGSLVMQDKRLYFIPGLAEDFDDGLGRVMVSMGYAIHGREMILDFARRLISEQVALIRSDLQPAFWDPDAVLVGRSYATCRKEPQAGGKQPVSRPALYGNTYWGGG